VVDIINISTSLIFNISIIIIAATILAYFLRLIKQPLIPAYIIAGVILGPVFGSLGLDLIKDLSAVNAMSEIGIAFLLFIVGLELALNKIKSVSVISILGGFLQVLLTTVIGFLAMKALGFTFISALYAGFIIAFSSTMLVVKILKDKEQVDTLHGKIMIGILIVQDILVIFVLSMISIVSFFDVSLLLMALLKGLLFILVALLTSKFFLPRLFRFAARSQELLFLCSLSICFLFALLAYYLGFSIAIGAFISGVMLANLPYSVNIIGMVGGLKNFFVTIFFVSLGMQLVMIPYSMIIVLVIILLLTLLVKPLIIMMLTSLFGYEKRTSFLTSFGLGQISEFSLIMVSFGFYTLNQLSQSFFSLIIFATIISMVITSYASKYDSWIYMKISRFLAIFEKLSLSRRNIGMEKRKKADIILFGCHRMGSVFLNSFEKENKKNIFVVDQNPEIIKSLMQKNIDCVYGDCTNIEVLKKINLKNAKLIISAIPSLDINEFLLKYAKNANKKIAFIATQNHLHEALDLYEKGADYVILPHISTSESAISLLNKMLNNRNNINEIRNKHIKHLLNLDMYGY